MKVDIVLLSWNFPDMTLKCLRTLKENTHVPYRLIWIDNGSEIENFGKIRKYVETFENYTAFGFDNNRYYAESTNKGIKLSDSKYVVTLSNDVFVTSGWLGKLVKILDQQPEIGLISPMTDNIGSNDPRASRTVPAFNLLKEGEPYEKINELPSRFTYCEDNVSMFCAVLRRKMIDKVGLLDERFTCYGNDFDYNERLKLVGWKTAVALNCFVRHLHKATKSVVFSDLEERSRIRKAHRLILEEKRRERARQG